MNTCYEFRTTIGNFYIVEHEGGYHAVYAGFSIGSCRRAEELAAALGYGYTFNLFGAEFGEIDTSVLGMPPDLSGWTPCSKPADIEEYCTKNSGFEPRNTGSPSNHDITAKNFTK